MGKIGCARNSYRNTEKRSNRSDTAEKATEANKHESNDWQHDSGSGIQSRIALDFEKLREAGRLIRQEERQSSSGVKILFRYKNPGVKTLKSAKDVERQLRNEGVLETFQTTQANDVNAKQEQKSETDSSHHDSDYVPPQNQLREESDGEW